MPDIKHTVTINALPENIFNLVATKVGIQKWLTREDGWKITGNENIGDTLVFYFGGNHHEMKISKLIPNKEVQWDCTVGPPDWVATSVCFAIETKGQKSILRFEHSGWAKQTDFFTLCDQVWKGCVTDIKNVAEDKAT